MHAALTATTFADPVTVPRADADGWIITGGEFPRPIAANAYRIPDAQRRGVETDRASARRRQPAISFLLFYFDVGTSLTSYSPDPPTIGDATAGPTSDRPSEDPLVDADSRSVTVRLLVNDFALDLPDRLSPDSPEPIADYFASPEHRAGATVGRHR